MTRSDERFVHPAQVPELWPIIRSGKRSKVRLFDLWCLDRDRLLEVLRVAGRPLAISQWGRLRNVVYVGGGDRHEWQGSRDLDMGLWVDGEAPLPRFPCSCAHQQLQVDGEWLRSQLAEGVQRRILDEATREQCGGWRRRRTARSGWNPKDV